MSRPSRIFGSFGLITPCVAAALAAASGCSSDVDEIGIDLGGTTSAAVGGSLNGGSKNGGTGSSAGVSSTAGKPAAGGSGNVGSGGAIGSGGTFGTGGSGGSGATISSGGAGGSSGSFGAGGTTATGGTFGTGGRAGTGGTFGNAGTFGFGGRSGTGGSAAGGRGGTTGAAGTAAGGSAGSVAMGDACATTTLPSGGTPHTSSNASGTAAGLAWTIWTNSSPGTITTFDTPAFSASWNNSGDYLARIGLQWNQSKTYDQYGTITAQFSSKKSGSGGGYSYIGMYGWSVSPCVEWYIVDDSFNNMPVNPGNTQNKGTATIDGGTYTLYTRATSGTGGSKCPGTSSWTQFYSVRQKARTCGQISLTEHFDAWAKAGMTLGKMDQAQILVEVGGGSGSVEFAVANVTTTQ